MITLLLVIILLNTKKDTTHSAVPVMNSRILLRPDVGKVWSFAYPVFLRHRRINLGRVFSWSPQNIELFFHLNLLFGWNFDSQFIKNRISHSN